MTCDDLIVKEWYYVTARDTMKWVIKIVACIVCSRIAVATSADFSISDSGMEESDLSFEIFPPEVVCHITSLLDTKSILNLQSTSKQNFESTKHYKALIADCFNQGLYLYRDNFDFLPLTDRDQDLKLIQEWINKKSKIGFWPNVFPFCLLQSSKKTAVSAGSLAAYARLQQYAESDTDFELYFMLGPSGNSKTSSKDTKSLKKLLRQSRIRLFELKGTSSFIVSALMKSFPTERLKVEHVRLSHVSFMNEKKLWIIYWILFVLK